MRKRNSYIVRYERDETGWWVASVVEVKGCHTQGRTIEQARERIREALALYVKDADAVRLVDDIRLTSTLNKLLDKLRQEEQQSEELRDRVAQHRRQVARALALAGLSNRDAGELLGVSRQRAQKLTAEAPSVRESRNARRTSGRAVKNVRTRLVTKRATSSGS